MGHDRPENRPGVAAGGELVPVVDDVHDARADQASNCVQYNLPVLSVESVNN